MNAMDMLVLIMSVGLIAYWANRGQAPATHPMGPAPHSPSSGADRLDPWRSMLLQLPAADRLVCICELHRIGSIDTETAVALIDEVG